jgi:hypothetical protein
MVAASKVGEWTGDLANRLLGNIRKARRFAGDIRKGKDFWQANDVRLKCGYRFHPSEHHFRHLLRAVGPQPVLRNAGDPNFSWQPIALCDGPLARRRAGPPGEARPHGCPGTQCCML